MFGGALAACGGISCCTSLVGVAGTCLGAALNASAGLPKANGLSWTGARLKVVPRATGEDFRDVGEACCNI
jgi:hypothetical protein